MSLRRIIFIICSIIFFAIVGYVVYDMSTQTLQPWKKDKPSKKEFF